MVLLFSSHFGDVVEIVRYDNESDPFWAERLRFIANNINDPDAILYSWLHCNDMFFGTKYSHEYESVLRKMRNIRLVSPNTTFQRLFKKEPYKTLLYRHFPDVYEVDSQVPMLNIGISREFELQLPKIDMILYDNTTLEDIEKLDGKVLLIAHDAFNYDFELYLNLVVGKEKYRSKREWDYLFRLAGFTQISAKFEEGDTRLFGVVYEK